MKGKELKQQYEVLTLKDGNDYKIEFTLNALCEIEEIFGDIQEVYKIFNNFNLKALRGILYCGLIEHQPDITERLTGSLFDMASMNATVEVLTKAFTKAFPSEEKETEENNQKK